MTFITEWIPCNEEIKLPALRTSRLLSKAKFRQFSEYFPQQKTLKESLVYNIRLLQEVKSEYLRNSSGCREKSTYILENINKDIVSLIHEEMKKIPNFSQLIFREEETEWLMYEEGDFFKVHQDFERYVCDDMVPYVLLYGLEDTILGGETMLYYNDDKFIFKESSKMNGAVFFPAHLPHEAKRVYKGVKKCLKLEFYVFFYPDDKRMIKCIDKLGRYDSIWRHSILSSIDCFISSYRHFDSLKDDKKEDILETDMAHELQKLSVALHDRKITMTVDDNYDFLFPNIDFVFLRDLYNLKSFMDSKKRIFISQDPLTWDWYHQSSNIGFIPLILLWTKNSKGGSYFLEDVYTKNGKNCYKDYCNYERFNDDKYIDFSIFKTHLCKDKIIQKEGRTRTSLYSIDYEKKLGCKTGKKIETEVNKEKWDKIYNDIRDIKLGDDVHPPRFHSASFQKTTYEMCNCEDAGFESYTEDVYITLYIQIRWILIRDPTL